MAAFPGVQKIAYEGPQSKNPLAFRHYNAAELVEGKSMKDHLRFSVAYWHTLRGTGGDPFGPGTMIRPWEGPIDDVPNAINRYDLAQRDALRTNPDGSVDLYLQSDSPGKDREANWLPAPKGKFVLVMRIYTPRKAAPSIVDGTWTPPPVKRVP